MFHFRSLAFFADGKPRSIGQMHLLIVVAVLVATSLGVHEQSDRQARDQRRLERILIALEAGLSRAAPFRAQIVVSEFPQGRDTDASRDQETLRRGTIAYQMPGVLRIDLGEPAKGIVGRPPLTQIGILSGGRLSVLDVDGNTAREVDASAWEQADLLTALDMVLRPGLAERFDIELGTDLTIYSGVGQVRPLLLTPVETSGPAEHISSIRLEVSNDGPYPLAIEIVRHGGSVTSVGFSGIDRNPRLPRRYFAVNDLTAAETRAVAPPGQPWHLHPVVGGGRELLYWNAPEYGGPVTSYRLEIGWFRGTAERARIEFGPLETNLELPSIPGGPFYMRLVATNEAGESPPSNEVVLDFTERWVFDATVREPAYASGGPNVLFDEGHNNYLAPEGDGRHLLDLLRNDGYRIRFGRDRLSPESLTGFDMAIIANPYSHSPEDWYHRGYEWWKWSAESRRPAFAPDEITAVIEFVRDGGSLLLALGEPPWSGAGSELAAALGAEVRNADTRPPDAIPGDVFESRALQFVTPEILEQIRQQANPNRPFHAGLLQMDHPILRGRDESERLWMVWTYLSQSLSGPSGAVSLLDVPDDARDWFKDAPGGEWQTISAAGRSQALAFELGRGRVVVLADATMLFARVWHPGSSAAPMGMALPEDFAAQADASIGPTPMNRQFALNVMHWLSGILDER